VLKKGGAWEDEFNGKRAAGSSKKSRYLRRFIALILKFMNSAYDFFDRFQVLSEESRLLVDEIVTKICVARGNIIISEGQINPFIYIIKKGCSHRLFAEKR
jgi:CRP-like cAMP-binding protein